RPRPARRQRDRVAAGEPGGRRPRRPHEGGAQRGGRGTGLRDRRGRGRRRGPHPAGAGRTRTADRIPDRAARRGTGRGPRPRVGRPGPVRGGPAGARPARLRPRTLMSRSQPAGLGRIPPLLLVPALLGTAVVVLPLLGLVSRSPWRALPDLLGEPDVRRALVLSLTTSTL